MVAQSSEHQWADAGMNEPILKTDKSEKVFFAVVSVIVAVLIALLAWLVN